MPTSPTLDSPSSTTWRWNLLWLSTTRPGPGDLLNLSRIQPQATSYRPCSRGLKALTRRQAFEALPWFTVARLDTEGARELPLRLGYCSRLRVSRSGSAPDRQRFQVGGAAAEPQLGARSSDLLEDWASRSTQGMSRNTCDLGRHPFLSERNPLGCHPTRASGR